MNHIEKARSRIYWQYRNSPKLIQWILALPAIAQAEASDQLKQIERILDIDSAQGEHLDVIGRIVGIDRPSLNVGDWRSFAYRGAPGAEPYGAAPYKDPGEPPATVAAPDYLFRLLIKAKIVKNNSAATIDEVKAAVDFVFGVESTVIDGQDMNMRTVWLEGEIPHNIRSIVEEFDLIPRPQGVKINRVSINEYPFAYKGTFSAQPYGVGRYITP